MENWQYVDDTKQYSIYFWVLKKKNQPKIDLLYGIAIENISQPPLDKWYQFDIPINKEFDIDAQIQRINCYVKGDKLKRIGNMLIEEKNLDVISAECCINELPECFSTFYLSQKCYKKRPVVFLESKDSAIFYNDFNRPISSLSDNPLFSESIILIKKEFLITADSNTDKIAFIKFLQKELVTELPFSIPGPDAERIGNFEVLTHPIFNTNDYNPIETEIQEINTSEFNINVKVKKDIFKGSIILNCCFRNGDVVIGDQIKHILKANQESLTTFKVQENCTNIEIKVWNDIANSEDCIDLIYERKVSIIRSIHMTYEFAGLSGELNAPWSDKLSKQSGRKKINNQFIKATREYSKINDYKSDLWVPAGRSIKKLFKDFLPEKSSARFFSEGWDKQNQFIEWLKDLAKKKEIEKICLIDPFFDDIAVTKFLALIEYDDIEYEVIADISNRAIRSKIIQSCEDIKFLLPSKLSILGLSRGTSNTDQVFHDRFLILFKDDALPDVFMLSNSINGVANNFSSVIVPVPPDIGLEVINYYKKMVKEEKLHDGSNISTEVLWPIEEKKEAAAIIEKSKFNIKFFPYIDILVETIFETNNIPNVQINDENELQMSEDSDIRKKQFTKLGDKLSFYLKNDLENALKLWCGIGNWLVRIKDSDRFKFFSWIKESKFKNDFLKIIEKSSSKAIENTYPFGFVGAKYNINTTNIANQAINSYIQQFDFSLMMIDQQFFSDYPIVYLISVGYEYLLIYHPIKAINKLEKIIDTLKKITSEKQTPFREAVYFKEFATYLEQFIKRLLSSGPDQSNHLMINGLKSKADLIRSLSSAYICKSISYSLDKCKEKELKKMINMLINLQSAKEKIFSLSQIMHNCLFFIEHSPNKIHEICKEVSEYIKMNMIKNWNSSVIFDEDLRMILKNISGPTEGQYEEDLLSFINLLIKQGKLEKKQNALMLLETILIDKIDNNLQGKKQLYEHPDLVFSLAVINFLQNKDPLLVIVLIKDLQKIVTTTIRNFRKPFFKNSFYSEWNASLESLYWCGILFKFILYKTQSFNSCVSSLLSEISTLDNESGDSFNDFQKLRKLYLKVTHNKALDYFDNFIKNEY